MVSSRATDVAGYLDGLDPDRAAEVRRVLEVVRPALPEGLTEGMGHGMIAWTVPLERYRETYNGEPMLYAALAAQARHLSLYLMPVYVGGRIDEAAFRARWSAARRLDMGRACVRFRTVDELDVPLVVEALGQFTVDGWIAASRAARGERSRG